MNIMKFVKRIKVIEDGWGVIKYACPCTYIKIIKYSVKKYVCQSVAERQWNCCHCPSCLTVIIMLLHSAYVIHPLESISMYGDILSSSSSSLPFCGFFHIMRSEKNKEMKKKIDET